MKITKKQYKKIEPLLPKPRGNFVVEYLKAILYVAENGCKWRALPRRYGHWNTVYRRFRRWAENGVLSQVLEVLRAYRRRFFGFVVGLDVCKIEAERRLRFLKKGARAIGRTKGPKQLATKVRTIVAGLTTPVALKLTPGSVGAAPVGREVLRNLNVKRLKSKFILMDRAYEGDATRQTARDVGLKPVVPPKRNRSNHWRYNKNFTNVETKSSVSLLKIPANRDALR